MLINILKCEPQERTEDQIDILIGDVFYFVLRGNVSVLVDERFI